MSSGKDCADCMENNLACLKILQSASFAMGVGIGRSAAFNTIFYSAQQQMPPRMNVFFIFQRRSTTGTSLPSWMTTGSKAFIKRFVRHSKSDPLVDEVKIIHVNRNYAQVRCPNGREMTVSLRNLVPCLQEDTADAKSLTHL